MRFLTYAAVLYCDRKPHAVNRKYTATKELYWPHYIHHISLNLNWKNAESLQTLYKHVNNLETMQTTATINGIFVWFWRFACRVYLMTSHWLANCAMFVSRRRETLGRRPWTVVSIDGASISEVNDDRRRCRLGILATGRTASQSKVNLPRDNHSLPQTKIISSPSRLLPLLFFSLFPLSLLFPPP